MLLKSLDLQTEGKGDWKKRQITIEHLLWAGPLYRETYLIVSSPNPMKLALPPFLKKKWSGGRRTWRRHKEFKNLPHILPSEKVRFKHKFAWLQNPCTRKSYLELEKNVYFTNSSLLLLPIFFPLFYNFLWVRIDTYENALGTVRHHNNCVVDGEGISYAPLN